MVSREGVEIVMVSLSPKHYFKRSVKCRFVTGGVVGESAGIQETIPVLLILLDKLGKHDLIKPFI